ncbi:hypothetical protein EI94DRAFT_475596 [Lactarius quietus]|nr:hypothetical protein EI94DRAFT_475596 [Lactarius quietus]
MCCIITEVNQHVKKGRSIAGLDAHTLVSENWQWSLCQCQHSPLKFLKKKPVGYEQEKRGGEVGGDVHAGSYTFRLLFLFPRIMLCSSARKKARNIMQFSPFTALCYPPYPRCSGHPCPSSLVATDNCGDAYNTTPWPWHLCFLHLGQRLSLRDIGIGLLGRTGSTVLTFLDFSSFL